jgi:hypothetical protein
LIRKIGDHAARLFQNDKVSAEEHFKILEKRHVDGLEAEA